MIRQAITDIDQQIAELKAEREELISALQKACKHDTIYEVDYIPSRFFNATPPFRVCKDCGYAEQGWNCGYWKLDTKEAVPIIRDEQGQKYVLKFYTQDKLSEIKYGKKAEAREN